MDRSGADPAGGLVVEPQPVVAPRPTDGAAVPTWPARLEATLARGDAVVVVAVTLLAAVVRFVGLAGRGTWDADQGHDMLVLRSFVQDGVVPLLGPPTSIGDFHHGAWYYYLLAPAAWLSSASPEGVVAAIALAGVAAVAITWWIGRTLGGPLAGLVAALVMAVSSSAIEESTFIWNPNLIALGSATAIAGAVRAWTTRRPRWWLVSGLGVAVTMQAHVLGAVFLPAFAAWLIADARRGGVESAAGGAGDVAGHRAAVLRAGLGCLAILAVAFAPLVVHELTSDFSEARAAIDFIRAGGEPVALALPARLLFVGLRIVSWPLVGLVTDALVPAVLAATVVVAVLVWRARAGAPAERDVTRWSGWTLLWSTVALAYAAGGLASVVRGLPNDHYHAFADPIVFVAVGLEAAALWRHGAAGAGLATVAIAALVAFNVAIWPPAVASDGGWPAARAAGTRIAAAVGDRSVALLGLPDFKNTDAVGFPLVDAGVRIEDASRAGALVVVCDRLFEKAIGAECGGPAEEAAVGRPDRFVALVDRFDVSPRTSVSVYVPRR